jgi:hypothetical protein
MAASGPLWIGRFAQAGEPPAPWRLVKHVGATPTSYRVARVAGRPAVEATVDSSMAMMARPVTVNLAETPILCWRWLIAAPVAKADMSKRSGDDYAARVYVAFDMPADSLDAGTKFKLRVARSMFGNTVPDAAVTYIWDNRHAVGTKRKSSYTSRSQLIVAETGAGRAGAWVEERANVAVDFANAFGGKPGHPIFVAVAADGDNTRSKGRAAFTDLHFVARDKPCAF